MKLKLLAILFLINALCVFGQTRRPSDIVVPNSNPPITQQMVENYLKAWEWIFSLRMTPDERSKYQSLLISDLKNGNLLKDVRALNEQVEGAKAKYREFSISETHYKQSLSFRNDRLNYNLNTQNLDKENSPWVDTLREARKGYASSMFLVRKIEDYDRVAVEDDRLRFRLYQKELDALFEWTNYRMKMVSGKKVDDSEAERQKMQQKIIGILNDRRTSDEDKRKLFGLAQSALNSWLSWRVVDYNFYDRFTPYQRKEQLVEWAVQMAEMFPEAKVYLAQRQKEYADYVNKMPPAELKAEYETKRRDDAKFAAYSDAQKDKLKTMQQGYDATKRMLVEWSVTSSNITENMGTRGGTWVIKTIP
jgi:hypothetical protein